MINQDEMLEGFIPPSASMNPAATVAPLPAGARVLALRFDPLRVGDR